MPKRQIWYCYQCSFGPCSVTLDFYCPNCQRPRDGFATLQTVPDLESDIEDEPGSQDELESLYPDSLPSLTTGSTVSSNESIEMASMLSNKFARILLEDNDFKPLCEWALKKMPYPKFERNIRRLLQTYAVDLRQEAQQQAERLAAKAIKRHLDKILMSLRTKLDPDEAAKAAGIDSLSKQEADKADILKSYLSESQYNEIQLQSITEKKYEEELSSDDSNGDIALSRSFDSVKSFLCHGAAFQNLKVNFRKFLQPSPKRSSRAAQIVHPETIAAEKTVIQQIKQDAVIKSVEGLTISRESRLEEDRHSTEQAQSLNIPTEPLLFVEDYSVVMSFNDRCKVSIERLLGQALLWWPLKEPLRPLGDGMRRLSWTCVSRAVFITDNEKTM